VSDDLLEKEPFDSEKLEGEVIAEDDELMGDPQYIERYLDMLAVRKAQGDMSVRESTELLAETIVRHGSDYEVVARAMELTNDQSAMKAGICEWVRKTEGNANYKGDKILIQESTDQPSIDKSPELVFRQYLTRQGNEFSNYVKNDISSELIDEFKDTISVQETVEIDRLLLDEPVNDRERAINNFAKKFGEFYRSRYKERRNKWTWV
jgi:hypothetical protein